MPRRPTRGFKSFIWKPRNGPDYELKKTITINGQDVTNDILRSSFGKAVCPEVGQFSIELINSDGAYNDSFSQNDIVILNMDFVDGTTERYEGYVDGIDKVFDSALGYNLRVYGGHLQGEAYDKTVTANFNGSFTIEEILTKISADKLPDHTVSYLATSTERPVIKWDAKSFWECVYDLCVLANADAIITDAKIIKFFNKYSILNTEEAAVYSDTVFEIPNLGKQTYTSKNKITVIGDDGEGLPVIATAQNTASQANIGRTKEVVLFDTKISTISQASNTATSVVAEQTGNEDNDEGDMECTILPSLVPGDMLYVTAPPLGINQQIRVHSINHIFPEERTIITFNEDRTDSQLFKTRIRKELALQSITNANEMTGSLNFPFDNPTELVTSDNNVAVSGGKVFLSSGAQGTFTLSGTSTVDITSTDLRVKGSVLGSMGIELSTNGGNTYRLINEGLNLDIPSGSDIFLRVTFNNAGCELESLALLYKA